MQLGSLGLLRQKNNAVAGGTDRYTNADCWKKAIVFDSFRYW